jgi:hypothetical protein
MDISETRMEKAIKEFLEGADADDIAYLAGFIFGGECYAYLKDNPVTNQCDLTYNFKPNENYGGEFGDFPR